MPIRMTNHAPGMTAAAYDEIMAHVAGPLSEAPGFLAHAAEAGPDGMTVTELWSSEADWRRWFDASVRPHLPAGAPDPEVVALHNAVA